MTASPLLSYAPATIPAERSPTRFLTSRQDAAAEHTCGLRSLAPGLSGTGAPKHPVPPVGTVQRGVRLIDALAQAVHPVVDATLMACGIQRRIALVAQAQGGAPVALAAGLTGEQASRHLDVKIPLVLLADLLELVLATVAKGQRKVIEQVTDSREPASGHRDAAVAGTIPAAKALHGVDFLQIQERTVGV